jgi:hypothetical protein
VARKVKTWKCQACARTADLCVVQQALGWLARSGGLEIAGEASDALGRLLCVPKDTPHTLVPGDCGAQYITLDSKYTDERHQKNISPES